MSCLVVQEIWKTWLPTGLTWRFPTRACCAATASERPIICAVYLVRKLNHVHQLARASWPPMAQTNLGMRIFSLLSYFPFSSSVTDVQQVKRRRRTRRSEIPRSDNERWLPIDERASIRRASTNEQRRLICSKSKSNQLCSLSLSPNSIHSTVIVIARSRTGAAERATSLAQINSLCNSCRARASLVGLAFVYSM